MNKKIKYEVSFEGITKTYKAIDEAQARYNFSKEKDCIDFFPLTLTVMSDGHNTYMKRDMTNFDKLSVKVIK